MTDLNTRELRSRFGRVLRCPFCGGEDLLLRGQNSLAPYVFCSWCRTEGPLPEETYDASDAETRSGRAVTRWNQRQP